MTALMVTGHRNIVPAGWTGAPWPNNPTVKAHHDRIRNTIGHFVLKVHQETGISTFISGMALGADQLFAEAVINLQVQGAPFKLVAAIPFKGQESKWPAASQKKYQEIMAHADHAVYVCDPGYAPWKMQKRNEWMVNNSTFCLAVWGGAQTGGTWNCIQYAKNTIVSIFRLDPTDPGITPDDIQPLTL